MKIASLELSLSWLFGGDCGGRGGGASLSGFGLSSLAESVVEFTVDDLHMAKTASSGRTTTDGLLRPLNQGKGRIKLDMTDGLLRPLNQGKDQVRYDG